MIRHEVMDSVGQDTAHEDLRSECEVPAYVSPMLQNVYLWHEKTTPPLEHRGDFWFWKLSAFGLDLMRMLVRSAQVPFSYCETIMQANASASPQINLLGDISTAVQSQLSGSKRVVNWAALLRQSRYLNEMQTLIDPEIFSQEIGSMIVQIEDGCYDPSGTRICRSRVKQRSQTATASGWKLSSSSSSTATTVSPS